MIAAYDPGDGPVTLARAQRVLARAYGFAGWSKLIEHVEVRADLTRPMEPTEESDDDTDRFLRLACLSYTEPYAADRAADLLAADPSLATRTAATLAACGRADELAEPAPPSIPVRSPGRTDRTAGRRCSTSAIPGWASASPSARLRVLLDAGADPNSGFLWQGLPSPFTALTGVLGGGERDEPPHPQAVELAELLLAAGADPNDNQAFYNRQFRPDNSHLGPLLRHGAGRDHPSPWRDRLGAAYPSPAQMLGEHLRTAAQHGFDERVRILLAHGVDPNTRGYHPILGDQTAYEIAVRHGHAAAAAMLAAAGGHSDRLDDADLLLAAALSGDAVAVAPLRVRVGDLPSRRPGAMRLAAEQHDLAALDRLVGLGYAVDAAGPDRVTALHEAALRGDRTCAMAARPRRRPNRPGPGFDGTPADWANHAGHSALAVRLGRHD